MANLLGVWAVMFLLGLVPELGVYLIVLATSVFYTAPIVFWIDSFMPVGGAVCDFVLVNYAGSLSNYEL